MDRLGSYERQKEKGEIKSVKMSRRHQTLKNVKQSKCLKKKRKEQSKCLKRKIKEKKSKCK